MVLNSQDDPYGLRCYFEPLGNVWEWTCLIPKPRTIKISITKRHVVTTTECSKEQFWEIDGGTTTFLSNQSLYFQAPNVCKSYRVFVQ